MHKTPFERIKQGQRQLSARQFGARDDRLEELTRLAEGDGQEAERPERNQAVVEMPPIYILIGDYIPNSAGAYSWEQILPGNTDSQVAGDPSAADGWLFGPNRSDEYITGSGQQTIVYAYELNGADDVAEGTRVLAWWDPTFCRLLFAKGSPASGQACRVLGPPIGTITGAGGNTAQVYQAYLERYDDTTQIVSDGPSCYVVEWNGNYLSEGAYDCILIGNYTYNTVTLGLYAFGYGKAGGFCVPIVTCINLGTCKATQKYLVLPPWLGAFLSDTPCSVLVPGSDDCNGTPGCAGALASLPPPCPQNGQSPPPPKQPPGPPTCGYCKGTVPGTLTLEATGMAVAAANGDWDLTQDVNGSCNWETTAGVSNNPSPGGWIFSINGSEGNCILAYYPVGGTVATISYQGNIFGSPWFGNPGALPCNFPVTLNSAFGGGPPTVTLYG